MAPVEIDKIKLNHLDRWFANIVDTLNYNLTELQNAVPAVEKTLTTIDTSPVQELKLSLDKLVEDINSIFQQIDRRLKALESKMKVGG